jgi:hypothetical protein
VKFHSFFNRPGTIPSPAGKTTRNIYVKKAADPEGKLVYSHTEDVYEAIQLAARGCLVKDLVSRSERGDTSAIGNPDFQSSDITNAPTSLMDAQNRLIEARSIFDKFPADVKKKYDNNFASFLAAVSSGEYLKTAKADKAAFEKAKSDAEAVDKQKPVFTDDQINFIKSKIGGSL